MDKWNSQAQGLQRFEEWLVGAFSWPLTPQPTPSCSRPKALTLWKRREMLLVKARAAMSQWILKTLYLAAGSGTEESGRASVRGRSGKV